MLTPKGFSIPVRWVMGSDEPIYNGMEADRHMKHTACNVLSQENRHALLVDGTGLFPCLSARLSVFAV